MSKPAEIATSIGNQNHCGLLVVWPKVGLGCAVKKAASHAPLSSNIYIYIYIYGIYDIYIYMVYMVYMIYMIYIYDIYIYHIYSIHTSLFYVLFL